MLGRSGFFDYFSPFLEFWPPAVAVASSATGGSSLSDVAAAANADRVDFGLLMTRSARPCFRCSHRRCMYELISAGVY